MLEETTMTTGSEPDVATAHGAAAGHGTIVGHRAIAPPSRTLVDVLESAAARFGDRPAVSMQADDGTMTRWSYRELERRSRLAAWRIRAMGLAPGDRILTWSPSAPELVAVYFGAMRAGVILVPLDLRMAPDAARRIAERAGAGHLVLGTGRDAPDPTGSGLDALPMTTTEALTADPGPDVPDDWEDRIATWHRPTPDDVYLLVYTSGTTGTPKGVMLAHGNTVAGIDGFHHVIPDIEYRIVSLLPMSHLFEQAIGLYLTLDLGADILYVRSRNPRVVTEAIRSHRTTGMVMVPQYLDLFWTGLLREIDRRGHRALFDRARRLVRRLPLALRRWIMGFVRDPVLGRDFVLFVSAGAYLPPAVQQGWEDIGVVVLQGYGSTETGSGTCTTWDDHPLGTVGRPLPGVEMRIAEDGEVQFRGPTVTRGYFDDPVATEAAFTADGFYMTGDLGHLDPGGRLVLHGRKKDMIVLPNGFNVFPEDVENALRVAGVRDSVVLETEPGRIEAVMLRTDDDEAAERARVEAAVKAANGTLAVHARVADWQFWPDEDFPRTLTLKVKRNEVRARVAPDAPMQVRQAE